jgi:hypothetical protein
MYKECMICCNFYQANKTDQRCFPSVVVVVVVVFDPSAKVTVKRKVIQDASLNSTYPGIVIYDEKDDKSIQNSRSRTCTVHSDCIRHVVVELPYQHGTCAGTTLCHGHCNDIKNVSATISCTRQW